MKLKEFESKQVISSAGIPISKGILIKNSSEISEFSEEKILKVQTLAGGRGKAGGIIPVSSKGQAKHVAEQFLGNTFLNEEISEILLDEKINIENELYLGMMFDTSTRKPVLIFSEEGGVDIEELRETGKIKTIEIDYLKGLTEFPTENPQLIELMKKLYTCFIENDCRMIEINPLVQSHNSYIAVDAVVVLDDDAKHRWKIPFEERTDNRKATDREIRARLIDKDDHRGVAGKTFIDLDGDIAILTSGGGATMTLMDALIEFGGKPANLTEYSGNPPQEKVEKLTRIVLEKEGLKGLLVAGVVANFTNIYETLQGVLNVLIEKKPTFPILIRRVGVEWEKARDAMMKAKEEHGLDIHYFDDKTPLTETAKEMVELSNNYKINSEMPQLSAEASIAVDAALEAGNAMMKIYHEGFSVSYKDKKEPLTEADIASNTILINHLSKTNYPILSEEIKDDGNRLNHSRIWIIDPLDGTSDFIKKNDEFTIMIGLIEEGRCFLGVIYQPAVNRICVAQKGKGAYQYKDGRWRHLKVSDINDISDSKAVVSRSHLIEYEKQFFQNLSLKEWSPKGSSVKVIAVSEGDAELYLTTTDKMNQWDTAASSIIITEAGGMITDLEGNELLYNTKDVSHKNGIVVTNGFIHSEIIKKYKNYKGINYGNTD